MIMMMMMMMMMMMIMNCFCGLVDRGKAFNLISISDHCQRSSPSPISGTPQARFEPSQNLISDLVEWSCAVVIPTTPRRHLPFEFEPFPFKNCLSSLLFIFNFYNDLVLSFHTITSMNVRRFNGWVSQWEWTADPSF